MSDRATIGPYRIVARVGAGGMGEVFKAWDPRLERDVAIKLLHREAAGDPERQKRLLAEGRAASALSHPNILRVYDADVDGDAYYLVSEWLEGKSLRDELARGPLPLKRLLDLAVQIADGLAAAHAMGIVHRDIKPENVMLARDGTARIVDFGLARAEHRASSTADTIAHSATVSLEGGISGTPAYMSPEQARGTLGDFRTDQFSFGAMLYELATGQNAFRRDSIADTLGAVLHDEPQPIADLNPRLPAAVRWIVEQCLAKDPGDRYGATEDLARELRRVRDRLAEATAAVRVEARDEAAPTRSRWSMLGAGAALCGLGAFVGIGLAPPGPGAMATRVIPFASAAEYEAEPSWSPDGQSLAYSADVDGVLQIFVKRVGDSLSRQITSGQFDSRSPFWSQDGQRVYFIALAGSEDALWSVAIAGGRPNLELHNVASGALDPDGSRLALIRVDETASLRQTLWWSSPPGAEPVREARPPFDRLRNGGDTAVRFSPDGQLLVWMYDIDTTTDAAQASTFYVLPKDGGAPRAILGALGRLIDPQPFGWWPDNRHIVLAVPDSIGNPHLWLADSVSGDLRAITTGHTGEAEPAVDTRGHRIAYSSQEVDFDLTLISVDGQSRRTFLGTTRNEYDPAWSPRGDQFAFVTDRSGRLEIWARSRDGQWERPVVSASDFPDSRTDTLGSLAFSPSGTTLAYQRSSGGTWEIWLSPASGGAPVRLVRQSSDTNRPWQDAPTWSPDGEWIAYVRNIVGQAKVMKTRVGTDETVELLSGALTFSRPAWSPDGQWIVAQTEAEGLVLLPANGGTPQPLSSQAIYAATWRPDSRHVVVLTDSEEKAGHFAIVEVPISGGELRVLNPDLGAVPIANQPIRGLSLLGAEGFLTSLASARSDIWILDGYRPPQAGLAGWLRGLLPRNPTIDPIENPRNP